MAVFIRLAGWAVLSQLLADDPHLFPENIIPLVFINACFHLTLKFPFYPSYFDLIDQMVHQNFIALAGIKSLQHLLAFMILPRKLDHDLVHQLIQIFDQQHRRNHFFGQLGKICAILLQFFLQNPAHGFSGNRIKILFLLQLQFFDPCHQHRIFTI